MRMIDPLHHFLSCRLGDESLAEAGLVVDNALGHPPSEQYRTRRKACNDFSSHSRTSLSLQSLPSLTSDSSISRWDSCGSPQKLCPSPPLRPRRSRRQSNEFEDRKECTPLPSYSLRQAVDHNCQSPRVPTRRSSIQTVISRPPCWEVDQEEDDGSPRSVRAGLDTILGQALQECKELDDAYRDCDEASIVAVL